ncbi:uncharacterized protein LOC124916818 [Impatiens glandulifera]|uniref:uncharacterized protein LOC124916818 n=1 Tax=Impatiens glandulifera TaxID=253017 RepID=UPI001FB0B538|nr:uncharacterized protein LOC124916818 [Impatiens glandulifera]XP_047313542.1 uncharacterized protein LOC124916818 [Impatiens glandulifera]
MELVIATVTGYHGVERCKLIKLISHSGASYVGKMSRSITHLVCWKFEGKKYELAKTFGIAIVNHRWIEECIRQGRRVPERGYVLKSGQDVGLLTLEAPPVAVKTRPSHKKSAFSTNFTERAISIGTDMLLSNENVVPDQQMNKHNSNRSKNEAIKKVSCLEPGSSSRNCNKLPQKYIVRGENKEQSSSVHALRKKKTRNDRTSPARSHKKRRLVKKHDVEYISSDSEEDIYVMNHWVGHGTSDPTNSDDVRVENVSRRNGDCEKPSDCVANRGEGLDQIKEDECVNLTLHDADVLKVEERTKQSMCAEVNNRLSETQHNSRSSTKDLSCIICWTESCSSRGVLPCGHRFCFSCIQQWSDMSVSKRKISTCPLCKASFSSITKLDGAASYDQKMYSQTIPYVSSSTNITVLPVADMLDPRSLPPPVTVCSECCCREPEDMLVKCHICNIRSIHCYCLDPPLFPWTCPHCKELQLVYYQMR